MKRFLLYAIFLTFSFTACNKEELSKGDATASPSFTTNWEFTADFTDGNDDGLVLIQLNHINDTTGLIYLIGITNIPLNEGSFQLQYVPEGIVSSEKKTEAHFYVMVDEDAVGEEYIIDSTNQLKCILELDCISKRSISGKFNIYFTLSKFSHGPKLDPTIPDSFSIENGIFNAKRL